MNEALFRFVHTHDICMSYPACGGGHRSLHERVERKIGYQDLIIVSTHDIGGRLASTGVTALSGSERGRE